MQLETRIAQMKAPAADQKGMMLKEYVSGEYSGIELFTKLPDICIEQAEQQLKEMSGSVTQEKVDED